MSLGLWEEARVPGDDLCRRGWMDGFMDFWMDRSTVFFMLHLKGNTGGLTHQQPSL